MSKKEIPPDVLEEIDKQFEQMQTEKAIEAIDRLFSASDEELAEEYNKNKEK